jgi:hypothetical protein
MVVNIRVEKEEERERKERTKKIKVRQKARQIDRGNARKKGQKEKAAKETSRNET